jgi:hypothetical protein
MTHLKLVEESDSLSVKLVNQLLALVLNGYNRDPIRVECAMDLADRYLSSYSSMDECVDGLIRWQMMYNSGTGFITGLGGLATLFVSIPSGLFAMWFIGKHKELQVIYLQS